MWFDFPEWFVNEMIHLSLAQTLLQMDAFLFWNMEEKITGQPGNPGSSEKWLLNWRISVGFCVQNETTGFSDNSTTRIRVETQKLQFMMAMISTILG